MKFGLIALSSLIILASANTTDLIGYANQKTRQELTQKINNNVVNKLTDTFGEDSGSKAAEKKYPEISSTTFAAVVKPVATKTVFPVIQNIPVSTNVQSVSSDKVNSIITISPATTVGKPAFVQATPAPAFSSLQAIKMAASTRNQVDQKPVEQKILLDTQPQIIQPIIQTQEVPAPVVLTLPQIIQAQSNLRSQNLEPAYTNFESEKIQPYNEKIQNQNIPEFENEDAAQQTQQYPTATLIEPEIVSNNQDYQSSSQTFEQLAPPTPLETQTLPIETYTTTPQQQVSTLYSSSNNAIVSSQPLTNPSTQDMVFLTPGLNIVRGVTNDIKGQQNILNGQNNIIKGHLNTAQGSQNQIMGLGNDIIASRAMVKGNQNVIIQDLSGVELF